MNFHFHPDAEAALSEAIQYYEDVEPGLGQDSAAEVYSAVQHAIAYPRARMVFESAVRESGDEVLKQIALELTEKLPRSTTVDWQKRESVRARLRNLTRITLRRHKYPPDKQEDAIRLVLSQAERLSDAWTK